MQKPDTILLDLDDTIVSFSAGARDYWREALAAELAEESARFEALLAAIIEVSQEFWGDEQRAAQARQVLIESRRTVARLAFERIGLIDHPRTHAVADAFTWAKEDAVVPFEGSVAALAALRERGFRLGLVTNGCSEFQRRKLERNQLTPFFDAIAIEGEWGVGKPHPTIFQSVLDRLGAEPSRTWMVGDNLRADIAGSQALGIFAVWNDAHQTGLPEKSPARPDLCVRNLGELVDILDGLCQG